MRWPLLIFFWSGGSSSHPVRSFTNQRPLEALGAGIGYGKRGGRSGRPGGIAPALVNSVSLRVANIATKQCCRVRSSADAVLPCFRNASRVHASACGGWWRPRSSLFLHRVSQEGTFFHKNPFGCGTMSYMMLGDHTVRFIPWNALLLFFLF